MPVACYSLSHAIDCIEQKIAEGIAESQGGTADMSKDSTQAPCDFY